MTRRQTTKDRVNSGRKGRRPAAKVPRAAARAQQGFVRDLTTISLALSGVGIEEFLGVTSRAVQLWLRGQKPAASMVVIVRHFALLAEEGLDLTRLACGDVAYEGDQEAVRLRAEVERLRARLATLEAAAAAKRNGLENLQPVAGALGDTRELAAQPATDATPPAAARPAPVPVVTAPALEPRQAPAPPAHGVPIRPRGGAVEVVSPARAARLVDAGQAEPVDWTEAQGKAVLEARRARQNAAEATLDRDGLLVGSTAPVAPVGPDKFSQGAHGPMARRSW